jgi:dGTPase
MAPMSWNALLSPTRLCRPAGKPSPTRSPFQQDADLVVFSAAFRRLQDKTQVQPLTVGGQVRTRLTHSIEVASVGRSLGTAVAHGLAERRGLDGEQCHAMAAVVHAACLAHDIGNPPFGHGGEDAIKGWFVAHPEVLRGVPAEDAADLCCFEGNAQGFRILTQLENYRFEGGLRLTHATLGAFLKYAVRAHARVDGAPELGRRKPGYFGTEQAYVDELRASLGVPEGTRHPLVYLTEAADDICYAIVDLEDGHDAGLVDYRDAVDVLTEIAAIPSDPRLGRDAQLHKLRGVAIGRLVDAVAQAFLEAEPQLLRAEAVAELLDLTRFGSSIARAKALAAERIFAAPSVVERLIGGQRVLSRLLDALYPVVDALEVVDFDRRALTGQPRALAQLLGEGYAPRCRTTALLGLTDFVSGQTDRAAVQLAQRLWGTGL